MSRLRLHVDDPPVASPLSQRFLGYWRREEMPKYLLAVAALFALLLSGSAMAQDQAPLLQRGTQELAVSGALDFENRGDTTLDLIGRYGYFLRNNLEVGGVAQFSGNFDDAFRYGLGGFAEYHVPQWLAPRWPSLVPYLGADVLLSFVDTDLGDDNAALIFEPRIGLKWFIRNYFAVETHFFAALATDDLFQNKRDELDFYDIGLRLGIRVFFH
jgi:hypothetical protein